MQKIFSDIKNRAKVLSTEEYFSKVDSVINVLDNENKSIRPDSDNDEPGGIIHLYHDIPTIIVPDLHARMELIEAIIMIKTEEKSFFELLEDKELQVVCVGDGFHSEIDGKERWNAAYAEYKKGYKKHKNIDDEMRDCFGLMEMVIELKTRYPDNFHFLKGNHENIKNEESGGDHPFRKFVLEGDMVKTWVTKFMGDEFLNRYSEFEKKLPLLAIGENFLISHAEPLTLFEPDEIRNYNPETIHGLTWTSNGEAEEDSVLKMLEMYVPDKKISEKYYFGGHRVISGKYRLRAEGLFVQIHNPRSLQIVYVKPDSNIDLENDIIELSGSK